MPLEIRNPDRHAKDFVIFYCWQDHLPKKLHRYLIREALTNAINRIQKEIPEGVDLTIRLDSDTEDRAGTVEIANTILKKINSSSMVVGDLTPVLRDEENGYFYPNPNVMLEVGYAAKSLGWNRVVCVFNNAADEEGRRVRAEDLPFDIRHRRLNSYVCSAESGTAQAIQTLEIELVAGIRAVIQEIDRGEFDPRLDEASLKRDRDLRLLRDLLNQVHGGSIDSYAEAAQQDALHDVCDFFWYGFHGLVCSSQFRFYDKKLERLVRTLWETWGQAVALSGFIFYPGDLPGRHRFKERHLWDEEYETSVNGWRQAVGGLLRFYRSLLDYVHEHYPEIDLKETNRNAWNDNLRYVTGDVFNGGAGNATDSGATDEDEPNEEEQSSSSNS